MTLRLLATFLAISSVLGSARAADAKPLRIVASFYPMYVTALNVTQDVPGVQVTCLTEPFVGCLHDYQLKPSDLKVLSKADVFVANGAGMESFLDKVLAQLPQMKIVNASEGVKLLEGNAHLWVSIRGAIKQTKRIASELAKLDTANAKHYEQNAKDYIAKLDALHDEIEKSLKPLKSRDVITFHEAFPYFAEEFDLNVVGVVEREPGAEPNARELANTIKLIRANKAAALFAEPQYSPKSAEVIARETGVPVSFLDPIVTGPMKPDEARDHYLAAMRGNLAALLKALPH